DKVSGAVTRENITQLSGCCQDIVCGTYDAYGNLYVLLASSSGTPAVNNVLFKVNASYNGYIWSAPSGFSSFNEIRNLPAFDVSSLNGSTNNNNALAANGCSLYYYDGYNLEAFDLANGSVLGTPATIQGYFPLCQGGIA